MTNTSGLTADPTCPIRSNGSPCAMLKPSSLPMRLDMKSSGSERNADDPKTSRKSHRDEGRTSIHGQALYVRPAEPITRTAACPGCFASLRSEQEAGLACRLGRRFKAFHALRSPPETRAPLRRLRVYPCPLCSGNHLLTQTISTAKSEQLFHSFRRRSHNAKAENPCRAECRERKN